MFARTIFSILGVFLSIASFVESSDITLCYPSEKKVAYTFETELDVETAFPDFTLNEGIRQKILAEVKLFDDENEEVEGEELGVEICLKNISAEIQENDKKNCYSTDEPKDSLEFIQLKGLLNRPFRFRLQANLSSENFAQLSFLEKEDSFAVNFLSKEVFSEMCQYLFLLGEKKLQQGLKIQHENGLEIDVNKISDGLVQATFGKQIQKGEESPEGEGVELEGVLSGTASWQSDNALMHKVKVYQSLFGELKNGEGVSSPVKIKIIHSIHTNPLEV